MEEGELFGEDLTGSVIGAFYEVYNELRYGFLENTYSKALERELKARGHIVGREVAVAVRYKGEFLTMQRLDMIVDDCLVVETKSSLLLPPAAMRQLQNYLRATDLELGLLLHFGLEPKFYRRYFPNSEKIRRHDDKSENGTTAGHSVKERSQRINCRITTDQNQSAWEESN